MDMGRSCAFGRHLFYIDSRILQPNEGYKTTQRSQRIIRAAGKRLVADKKAAILAEKANDDKDILSLLSSWKMSIFSNSTA